MKSTLRFAAVFVLSAAIGAALSFAPASTAVAKDKKPTVSRELAKPLKHAQDAIKKGQYKKALEDLNKAKAESKKTPYDEYVINELSGFAYIRTHDYKDAAPALEAALNSGFLDPAAVPQHVQALAQVNYQLKDYGKAIQYGTRYLMNHPGNSNMFTLVSQAYYLKGDYKGTRRFVNRYVDQEIRQGKTPSKQSLNLVLSSCIKMQDSSCETDAMERMVEYYPSKQYWQNLMESLFRVKGGNDTTLLDVYRLAFAVHALRDPQDYREMAQIAIEKGSPGEAVEALQYALDNNVFTDPHDKSSNQRLLAHAKKLAASDQASLAQLAKSAQSSASGEKDVGLGLAYLSYQQYDKAIAALKQGLMKGNLKDEAQARLLLGIAELKGGKTSSATKTFEQVKKVKGANPVLTRVAHLWSLHARQPS